MEPVWPTSLNMYEGSSRLWLDVFYFCVFCFWPCPGQVVNLNLRGVRFALLVTTCVKYEMPSVGPILTHRTRPKQGLKSEIGSSI